MKKTAIILLALLLMLAGCQQPSQEIPETDPAVIETDPVVPEETIEATEAPTVPEEVVYEQQTMYAVSMPLVTESVSAEDGNPVFSHTYQNMQLTLQDPEVANRIIVDFLNRLDEVHNRTQDAVTAAQQQYSAGENWVTHYIDICYSTARIDQVILSLYGIEGIYSGEGRPIQVCHGANYSMLTGEVLSLGSILTHVDAKEQLVDAVIQTAASLADDLQLYGDYAECIRQRFDTEESFDEDWYFTDQGLCFYFAPYEIAPYSTGIVILELPYSQLTGIITDEFFPPESEETKGSIQALHFADADMSQYTQIAEVITDADGGMYLLYAQGAISDLYIESGSWNQDGTQFIPDCTIFASASLTPGDGVMVQSFIPDTMPRLRITYRSGEETVSLFLFESGKDGSVLLIE